MPKYKDQSGGIHVIDSPQFAYLLPPGCVPITDIEAAELLAPTPEQITAVEQAVKDLADIAAAKSYAKLTALKRMTPAQVQAWVAANVTNLAQAQDAIATLAIAVGILARRL